MVVSRELSLPEVRVSRIITQREVRDLVHMTIALTSLRTRSGGSLVVRKPKRQRFMVIAEGRLDFFDTAELADLHPAVAPRYSVDLARYRAVVDASLPPLMFGLEPARTAPSGDGEHTRPQLPAW